MIEIEIPKDIRAYETKLIGPLSGRKAACVGIATPIALVAWNLLESFPTDTRLILSAIFCLPVLLFWWLKPFGMKLEDFLKTTFVSTVLSPKRRLYVTENVYGYSYKEIQELKNKQKQKDKKHIASSTHIAFE